MVGIAGRNSFSNRIGRVVEQLALPVCTYTRYLHEAECLLASRRFQYET